MRKLNSPSGLSPFVSMRGPERNNASTSSVEARDSGSGLQSENPVLATGDRKKKPNVNESRRMKERLAMTAVARNEAMSGGASGRLSGSLFPGACDDGSAGAFLESVKCVGGKVAEFFEETARPADLDSIDLG